MHCGDLACCLLASFSSLCCYITSVCCSLWLPNKLCAFEFSEQYLLLNVEIFMGVQFCIIDQINTLDNTLDVSQNLSQLSNMITNVIVRHLKHPVGTENKRGSPRFAVGEVETRKWRTTCLIPCRSPGSSLSGDWGRRLETGKYFDVAFEGAQAANWHEHSGTPSDSLASQGWCWQCCCRLCWCYLETNNTTFICLVSRSPGREGRLPRHRLIPTSLLSWN